MPLVLSNGNVALFRLFSCPWHAVHDTVLNSVFIATQFNLSKQMLTYLWTQSLHHVTEKFIKLFVLNVAIILQTKTSITNLFSLYSLAKPEDKLNMVLPVVEHAIYCPYHLHQSVAIFPGNQLRPGSQKHSPFLRRANCQLFTWTAMTNCSVACLVDICSLWLSKENHTSSVCVCVSKDRDRLQCSLVFAIWWLNS